MKTLLITTITVFVLSCSALAQSLTGNEGSGGGWAVVCRDANQEIVSARMLDVYKYMFTDDAPLPTTLPTGDVKKDRELVKAELTKFFANDEVWGKGPSPLKNLLQVYYWRAFNGIHDEVDELDQAESLEEHLVAPTDIGRSAPLRLKKGCEPELAVYFAKDTYSNFEVSGEIWQKLSIANRLAAVMHEGTYAIRRDFFADTDSEVSQRFTTIFLRAAYHKDHVYPWDASIEGDNMLHQILRVAAFDMNDTRKRITATLKPDPKRDDMEGKVELTINVELHDRTQAKSKVATIPLKLSRDKLTATAELPWIGDWSEITLEDDFGLDDKHLQISIEEEIIVRTPPRTETPTWTMVILFLEHGGFTRFGFDTHTSDNPGHWRVLGGKGRLRDLPDLAPWREL